MTRKTILTVSLVIRKIRTAALTVGTAIPNSTLSAVNRREEGEVEAEEEVVGGQARDTKAFSLVGKPSRAVEFELPVSRMLCPVGRLRGDRIGDSEWRA